MAKLDSVRTETISVNGRRDTLVVSVEAGSLPDWCTTEPERVEVRIPLELSLVRRYPVEVESPHGAESYHASPSRVTAIVTTSRRHPAAGAAEIHAEWRADPPYSRRVGHHVAVRARDQVPGLDARFEPDSVTLMPENP